MRTNSLTDSMQSTVNQRLWNFVELHGGVAKVALHLGVTKQTLYNFRDNRTFPSAGTLALICQMYPGTDMNHFLSVEEGSLKLATDAKPADPGLRETVNKLSSKIEKLEAAKERLENTNNQLMGQLLQLTHPELFRDREGSKLMSDSLVTEHHLYQQQRNPMGFELEIN